MAFETAEKGMTWPRNRPESRVGAQRQRGKVWVVVQVDRGHTGRQDVDHPHRHNTPVQPVLLVEGAVAHLRPIWRIFSLGRRSKERRGGGGHWSKQL